MALLLTNIVDLSAKKSEKNRFFFYARILRNKILYLILCLIFIVLINIKQRRNSYRYCILSGPDSHVKTKTKNKNKILKVQNHELQSQKGKINK